MAVYLIAGPPCSGKTTLAQRMAGPGDQVLDFDLICTELDGKPGWSHEKWVRERAGRVLDCRIRQIRRHGGDTYLVRGAPNCLERTRLARSLGAKVWLLNPGRAECVRRARHGRRPARTAQAIRDWYGQYRPGPLDQSPPELEAPA